jgi:uncharacterized protein (TIGR00251 family)
MGSWRWIGEDLELQVHAQPGAKRTKAQGLHGGAIKVRIAAPPLEGKANDALIAFVADALQVPRRQCVLISGHASRQKRLRIQAPDRALSERVIAAWLQTSS